MTKKKPAAKETRSKTSLAAERDATPGRRARPASAFSRSPCPIANLLDLVGDKWSLLLVRDLLHGRSTYGALATASKKIPTNIRAERLKRLEKGGLITRKPYQLRPTRYFHELMKKGHDLGEVLLAVGETGQTSPSRHARPSIRLRPSRLVAARK